MGNTDSDQITISLPEGLTAEQKEWMNHPNTRALIGQLLYQVVTKPNKAFEFNQTLENKQEENTAFKANAAIQKFAQKTFLDFDDDD